MNPANFKDDFPRWDLVWKLCKESDLNRQILLDEILGKLYALSEEHEQTCRDLEHERVSRQTFQAQLKESQTKLERLAIINGGESFVVALIDGDRAPFVDELLQLGRDGGLQAAARLRTEIKNYIEGRYPNLAGADWTICVQIFVNLEAMAAKLQNDIREFRVILQEFNSTPLFSITDVGCGKERTVNQLREWFPFYYSNRQCQHILVGCDDTFYDNTLRQYKQDSNTDSKITLVISADQRNQNYKFETTRFPTVFRSESISLRAPPLHRPTRPPSALPSRNATPIASLGKNFILLNKAGQRIDPLLPKVSQDAFDRITNRIKLCNNYVLKGTCSVKNCCFSHPDDVPEDEKIALSRLARTTPCQSGSSCKIFDCFSGHHCRMDDCGKKNCKLKHKVDKHVISIVYRQVKPFRGKQPYY